jgi:hypothetical protein
MSDKFSVSTDQYISLDGQLTKIKNIIHLGLTKCCQYDPKLIENALQAIIEGKFNDNITTSEREPLSLLSERKIKAVDGTATIVQAKDVFNSHCGISKDFKAFRTGRKDLPTKEILVDVYYLCRDATLLEMFESLSSNLDSLCLTQAQIIEFCSHSTDLFEHNIMKNIFFLFKVEDQFFITTVSMLQDGLRATVSRLKSSGFWRRSDDNLVIVPQLVNS